jgi:hypothetical protein
MSKLLADVQRDAPQLVWLMQLALDNGIPMNPKLEAVAALKQAILKKTGSEAQWRLLCHSKRQDFDTLLNHPTAQLPWLALRQWLRFLDDIGATRQLPEPVIRLLLNALIVQIGYLIEPKDLTRLYPEAVLRIMARECLDRDGLRPDLMERFAADEVAIVLEWVGPEKVKLDRNQEKSGWQHLLRRARSWQKRTLHKCLLGMESVPTLIDQMETDSYVVKPLNTPYLLWDEGFQMHHCVGKLWNLAANGKSRFFSIRQVGGDKRVATVELQKEALGKWKVFDCRRYFNAEATPELLDVSQSLADSYSQAERLAA